MGSTSIQALVTGAESRHALPTRHAHISNAIKALAAIDDNLPSPEDLRVMLAELGRIASSMDNGELRGLTAVVDLIGQAHSACRHISQACCICSACCGSGEGRFSGRCHVCGGHGEVRQ